MRVVFLPPNTTIKVQLLGAGISAWLKAKYKRRLLLSVFDNIESSKKSIYNVDVLTVTRQTERERENGPAQVINYCFTHSSKQDRQEYSTRASAEETLTCMSNDAVEHRVSVWKANLRYLLNPDEKNHVDEDVTFQELGREIAAVNNPVSEEEEESDDDKLYTNVGTQLQSLAFAKATLDTAGI